MVNGYHSEDGWSIEPLDDRDEDDPEYRIDPILSSSNTGFGGEDPAKTTVLSGTPAEKATFDPRKEEA
jgi:hypothetical protein